MVDQNGENLSVFQNLKLHFIQIDIFFAGVHWVIYIIKWELKQNQKIDVMGTLKQSLLSKFRLQRVRSISNVRELC